MTAFYMFRLLWLTFFGASRMTPEVEHHVHESPLSMTGVLMLLALLSARGRLHRACRTSSSRNCRCPRCTKRCTTSKRRCSCCRSCSRWPAWPVPRSSTAAAPRAPNGCSGASPALHRWLSGKYFIDELYERVIGQPLVWVSDRVFLRLGDRALLDGTLNGLAALGQRGAGLLGRVQTGSLHLYAWFVLVGIVGALLWSWRHV